MFSLRAFVRVLTLCALVVSQVILAPPANAAPGDLDPSFGTNGVVLTDLGSSSLDFARGIKVQPDGKILAAGSSDAGGDFDFALVRYNSNGSLDAGFGSSGTVLTDLGSASDDRASAVAIQPNGKIVVAGLSNATGDYDFAVVRYNADGSLDAGFGSGGTVLTDLGSISNDFASGVEVQPNGMIVVAGSSDATGNYDFAVVRYNADGSLDAGFGSGGKVLTDLGSANIDQAADLAIQQDGKIVVAGLGDAGGGRDFAVVRYNADGSLDAGFGSSGKVVTDLSTNIDYASGVHVQPNGKIVAVGFSLVRGGDFALVRYNADGSLDTGFGSGGKVLTDLGSGSDDEPFALAIQQDGKIIATGFSDAGGVDFALALVRYNPDGSLDAGFGSGGKAQTNSASPDEAHAVAIQPDGKIVIAGDSAINGSGDFALARYQAVPTTPPPSISSFSPPSGPVGVSVSIVGANFGGASSVTFYGVAQPSFTVNPTGTLITAAVPAGASTGPIRVATPSGTASSVDSFIVTTSAHERNVTLSFRGHLWAKGFVVVTDGYAGCFQVMQVRIQRRTSDHWRTIATDQSGIDGSFTQRLPDRTGWYRAKVNEVTLANGDICNGATSGTRHHRRSA